MKNYHDVGGGEAGPICRDELPWRHWQKQVEAIRNLLGDTQWIYARHAVSLRNRLDAFRRTQQLNEPLV
jgi:hypothetical protein